MLAFNLKLLGRKSRKKILISAGRQENKKRMLPAIKQFLTLEVDIYSTPGTHKFLFDRGIDTTEIHKITDRRAPNILIFLKENRFDLVINVLTGDNDYDEASDAKLIRKLCIENGIPLITDADVGIATLEQIVTDNDQGHLPLQARGQSEPWNLRLHFMEEVESAGRGRQPPRPFRQGLSHQHGEPPPQPGGHAEEVGDLPLPQGKLHLRRPDRAHQPRPRQDDRAGRHLLPDHGGRRQHGWPAAGDGRDGGEEALCRDTSPSR